MRNLSLTIVVVSLLTVFSMAARPALSQTAPSQATPSPAFPADGPAYLNPADWHSVKPIVTDDIVYATVPHVVNPSAEASPNPGTPNGIRPNPPNTGPAGTLDLHLDVYQVPSGKPTPVVIQIHGGGWIRGDRPSSSGSMGPFFAAGMSVVAVQYRNAIDAPAPAAIEDVRCAMSWVKKSAAKYNFDPNKVVTWGGSAGGHLALMAAYAPASFDPPGCTDQPKVVAVIDMYGASDVAESLTYSGSRDFTHQWIGLDLPLPRDPAPAATAGPSAAPAAGSAEPVNPDGMPRPRPQAPRWPDPTEAMLARARGHGNFSAAENQKGTILWMQFLHDHGVIP